MFGIVLQFENHLWTRIQRDREILKTIDFGIGWQVFRETQIDAEQILHRVIQGGVAESANRDATVIALGGHGGPQSRINRSDHLRHQRGIGPDFLLWRHVADDQHIRHILPRNRVARLSEIEPQGIEPDIALLLLLIVTFKTVLLHEGSEQLAKIIHGRRGSGNQ